MTTTAMSAPRMSQGSAVASRLAGAWPGVTVTCAEAFFEIASSVTTTVTVTTPVRPPAVNVVVVPEVGLTEPRASLTDQTRTVATEGQPDPPEQLGFAVSAKLPPVPTEAVRGLSETPWSTGGGVEEIMIVAFALLTVPSRATVAVSSTTPGWE